MEAANSFYFHKKCRALNFNDELVFGKFLFFQDGGFQAAIINEHRKIVYVTVANLEFLEEAENDGDEVVVP